MHNCSVYIEELGCDLIERDGSHREGLGITVGQGSIELEPTNYAKVGTVEASWARLDIPHVCCSWD